MLVVYQYSIPKERKITIGDENQVTLTSYTDEERADPRKEIALVYKYEEEGGMFVQSLEPVLPEPANQLPEPLSPAMVKKAADLSFRIYKKDATHPTVKR